jgi:hypothetical protein
VFQEKGKNDGYNGQTDPSRGCCCGPVDSGLPSLIVLTAEPFLDFIHLDCLVNLQCGHCLDGFVDLCICFPFQEIQLCHLNFVTDEFLFFVDVHEGLECKFPSDHGAARFCSNVGETFFHLEEVGPVGASFSDGRFFMHES